MSSALIFSDLTNLFLTIGCLIIFYSATKFAIKDDVVNSAIMYCFRGFLFCFLSSWFITSSHLLPIDVNFEVLIELSLLVVALCYFVAFATQILLDSKPEKIVIIAVGLGGFVLIVNFLFFFPDGAMIEKIRNLFPFAGFCYLAVAFWSKASKMGFSYSLAAGVSSYVSVLYLINFTDFTFVDELWWSPALVYMIMSMAFLMMRSADLDQKLVVVTKKMKTNNAKFKEIIDHSPFPIVISRLSDDKILVANENAINLFGIYQNDLERYKLKDFFADPKARRELSERLEKETSVKDFEFLSDTQSALSPFWLLTSASIVDYDMSPAIYMALQDITSRKNKETLLKDQATKDPLTGIFNRRYFEDNAPIKIKEAKEATQSCAVMMLDADHFKNVNDTYGHKTGDKVLIELASIADKALRDSDIVARFGGEEFVLFLSEADEAQAVSVANRLRESISKIVVKAEDGRDVRFTVSIGLCTTFHTSDIGEMIKNADLALYKAKENGRNRVEAYTTDFDVDASKASEKQEASHHPIYDEIEEEISLIDETTAITNDALDTAEEVIKDDM